MPNDISKNKVRKYDGIDNKAIDVNCYLIGQLGKNDKYKYSIKGQEILSYSINIIQKCREFVGGRLVLVECEDKPELIKFYEDNKFEYLTTDEETNLLQFIFLLNNTEFIKKQNGDIKHLSNISTCEMQ